MAEVTPPLFQNIDSVYTAADLATPFRDIVSEGVAGTTDLAVSQRAAGANMSVDVAAGVAWVQGDASALQPTYRVYNDGTVNLAIAAADGTNPRIDLVIAEVRDAAFSGTSTDWRLRVVTGTPAGSPAAPATPDSALVLARVSVPASDTTIETAQITDYRKRAGLFGALAVPTVTALPTDPYDGQIVDYLADAGNGVVWRLKYRAAATTYKWEFVGGSPLRNEVVTSQSTTSTSYVNLTTTGPALNAPRAGFYRIEFGARVVATSGQLAMVSAQWSGAAAVDTDGAWLGGSASTADGHPYRTLRKTVAASQGISLKYRSSAGGSQTFSDRYLEITPVAVI